MMYWLGINVIVLLHASFVCFVVAGGLLILKKRWLAFLHIPAVIWGALIEFRGWICPLTPLENKLRVAAGQQGYSGGFIEHYILPVLYPASLDRDMQIWLGIGAIGINCLVYGWIINKLIRNRQRELGRG